jgi:hypothetical protein
MKYDGILTRDNSGEWAHCGKRVIYVEHECGIKSCFNTVCNLHGCEWDYPDCVRDTETVDAVCHYCLSEDCEAQCSGKQGAQK